MLGNSGKGLISIGGLEKNTPQVGTFGNYFPDYFIALYRPRTEAGSSTTGGDIGKSETAPRAQHRTRRTSIGEWWHRAGECLNPSERTWLRLLVTRAHLGRLPLGSAAAVAEDLAGDHAPLVLGDLGQDTREGEDILHGPLAGGRSMLWNTSSGVPGLKRRGPYTEVKEESPGRRACRA